jgi:hypothetical protein
VNFPKAPYKFGNDTDVFYADSMEEASALANKVGIMAKQMLGMPYIVDV